MAKRSEPKLLQVKITKELHQDLKVMAARQGVTLQALVAKALAAYANA